MAKSSARPLKELLRDARLTLSMTQAEFGPALGWSHRTAVRWERGRSIPLAGSFVKLAALLAPVDLELAAEAAHVAGETLVSLGLAPSPKEQAEEKPPPRHAPGDLVDAVVCAVADATDLLPRALRPLLHAAFARARALGLTVEQVEEGLRVRVEAKADKREPPRLRVRVEAEEPGEREAEPPAERRSRAKGP